MWKGAVLKRRKVTPTNDVDWANDAKVQIPPTRPLFFLSKRDDKYGK